MTDPTPPSAPKAQLDELQRQYNFHPSWGARQFSAPTAE